MKREVFLGLVVIVTLSILWAWRAPGPYQLVEIDGHKAVCDTRTGETWTRYTNGVTYMNPKTGEEVLIHRTPKKK